MVNPAAIDPESGWQDGFDDRPAFIVKVADPVHAKRGRNNRRRGMAVERELWRWFEAEGFEVISQGGPNRRDAVVVYKGVTYSVEVKSMQRRVRPGDGRQALLQAIRQAKAGSVPIAFLRGIHGNKSEWMVSCGDAHMLRSAWRVMVDEAIPLGEGA